MKVLCISHTTDVCKKDIVYCIVTSVVRIPAAGAIIDAYGVGVVVGVTVGRVAIGSETPRVAVGGVAMGSETAGVSVGNTVDVGVPGIVVGVGGTGSIGTGELE